MTECCYKQRSLNIRSARSLTNNRRGIRPPEMGHRCRDCRSRIRRHNRLRGRKNVVRPKISASAGNIVPFVLWFNFIAAFAYLMAGLGLLLWKRWAAQLSAGIAVATLAVFAAFGIHVALGGAFEA